MLRRKKYIEVPTRAEFALQKFRPYMQGKIVDIGAGGSAAIFRKNLGENYFAADISDSRNNPDLFIDFENPKLPFETGQFDTVLSFDCIEHCDNIHEIFDELIRVSKRYVIISLPNNWPGFVTSIMKGRHVSNIVGYGLPPEPQGKGVRHKWWFNLEEAEKFIRHRTAKAGARVVELRHVYTPGGDNFLSIKGFYPQIMRANKLTIQRFHERSETDVARFGKAAVIAWKLSHKIGIPATQALFSVFKLVFGYPLAIVDEVFKTSIWGWGSPYRYKNMFCGNVWAVIEKPVK